MSNQSAADAARDRMIGEIANGSTNIVGDASQKALLVRGCDPQMAARASKMLPPLLGNPVFDTATNDDEFIMKLKARQYNVIMFAPGACRYNAASRVIPGGNAMTHGWTLVNYRALVRKYQADDVAIVETTEEREIVPKLQVALGL